MLENIKKTPLELEDYLSEPSEFEFENYKIEMNQFGRHFTAKKDF